MSGLTIGSLEPERYKHRVWRCEQQVGDEWINIPLSDLALYQGLNQPTRLMRGDREVGGPWRLWVDDTLYATWVPWLDRRLP